MSIIKKLNLMANIMNAYADEENKQYSFYVERVWQDYGAGLMWNTIICYRNNDDDSYQMLSPRQMKEVEVSSVDELIPMAKELYENKL